MSKLCENNKYKVVEVDSLHSIVKIGNKLQYELPLVNLERLYKLLDDNDMVPDSCTLGALNAIDASLRRSGFFLMYTSTEREAFLKEVIRLTGNFLDLPEEIRNESVNCEPIKLANTGYFGYGTEATGKLSDMGEGIRDSSKGKGGYSDSATKLMESQGYWGQREQNVSIPDEKGILLNF